MNIFFNLMIVLSIFYIFYRGVCSIFGDIKRAIIRVISTMKGSAQNAQRDNSNDVHGTDVTIPEID